MPPTASLAAVPTPGATLPAPVAPTLGSVARRVGINLLVACVVPAALFYTCFVQSGVWTAMGAALAWSYGALAFRALTGRRTSGLLVLTALVLTARTGIALASSSTFVYFLQPILSDAVVGLLFVGSLATARPMVARLAGDFYPFDDELAARPRIGALMLQLTALWATLCLGKAAAMLWFLQTQPMDVFVRIQSLATPTANVTAAAATVALAAFVARREGLIAAPRPAEEDLDLLPMAA